MIFSILLYNQHITLYSLSSVAQSCPTLYNSMDAACQASLSITNFQSLLKLMFIELVIPSNHSHPLSSPSPPAFNLSQHQGLFQWISFSHQVTKLWSFSSSLSLPMDIQDWFPLGLTGWISLLSKGLSRVFSNTTVQKHQYFGAQLSL